jgi:ATP-binding cassette subfamily B protein
MSSLTQSPPPAGDPASEGRDGGNARDRRTNSSRRGQRPPAVGHDLTPDQRPGAIRALRRLAPYAKPARARIIGSGSAALLAAAAGLVVPLVLKQLIDGPIAHAGRGSLHGLLLPAGLVLVLGVAEAALFGIRRQLTSRALPRVEAAMRADLYAKLQRLPVAFHDRWPSGQLLSRAISDLSTIRQFLAFGLVFLFVNGTTFLIGIGVLIALAWPLGLVTVAFAIPLVWLSTMFETRYRVATRRSQDQVGDLATITEESVLGIRVLKAFGRHRTMARRFLGQAELLRRTELWKVRLIATLWCLIVALPETAIGIALAIGVVQVAHGVLTTGTLVAYFSTVMALRWPVESIGWLLAQANDAASATIRYFEVLDEPEPFADDPPPSDRQPSDRQPLDESSAPADRRGVLGFHGVRFHYPDAPEHGRDLLRGIDLEVRPGETMALVGATGSGKTTLTSLVPRLYDPTGGRITVHGTDIRTLPPARLRELVSVAFEDPVLFSASVRDNVAMGAADPDEEAVRRALRIAQADFVEGLPDGLDTQVGEQGLSLSGGQRQRLALARAVVGAPEFLVLDDPLSALDVHTEALVEEALRQVLASTTALVVAHRPSTVQLADRVALLADGRIAAVGTHAELLAASPAYRELISSPAPSRSPE